MFATEEQKKTGMCWDNEAELYKAAPSIGKGEGANLVALTTYVSATSKGLRFNLPNNTVQEKTMYEVGKRLFFARSGTHDFSCSSCHGEDNKRVRLQDLPIVHKAELMHRFSDWVTDPAVTLEALQRFTADPTQIGDPFLGRYAVWESSGSSGEPGIFIQDAAAMADLLNRIIAIGGTTAHRRSQATPPSPQGP